MYVLAFDNSSIQLISGSLGVSAGEESGAGIGLSLIVNDIQTATKAEIANSQVDAAGQALSVNPNGVSGTLSTASGNAPDVSQIAAPRAATYPLLENQNTVNGLTVDATADEQVIADTVSIGLQASEEPGAGIGVNVLVNLMGGSTTADITGSKIDTTFGANGLPVGYVVPAVYLNASSHMFAGDFVVPVAVSLYGGLAGAAEAAQVKRTTNAYISGGQIGSVVQSTSSATNGISRARGRTAASKRLATPISPRAPSR